MALSWYVIAPPTTAALNATIKKAVAKMSGAQPLIGPLQAQNQAPVMSMTGKVPYLGPLVSTNKAVSANLVGRQEIPGTMGVSTKAPVCDIFQASFSSKIGASNPAALFNAVGKSPVSGALGASATKVAANIVSKQNYPFALSTSLKKAVASLAGKQVQNGSLSPALGKAVLKALGRILQTPIPNLITAFGTSGDITTASPGTGTITNWTPQVNDIVVFWCSRPQTVAGLPPTAPAGWTLVTNVATGNYGGTAGSVTVVYHVVTQAEADAGTKAWTLTNLFSSSNRMRRHAYILRGVDPNNPIDQVVTNTNDGLGSATSTFTVPDVTPTVNGGIVTAHLGGNRIGTNCTFANPGAGNWSTALATNATSANTPIAMTEVNIRPGTKGVATAGRSGNITQNTDDWANVVIAWNPILTPFVIASSTANFTNARSPDTGTFTGATLQAGDVVLTWFVTGNALTMALPAGWSNPLGGNTFISDPVGHSHGFIYHVVADAEETAGTLAWTLTNLISDTSHSGITFSLVVRGADPQNPIDAFTYNSGAASTTHTIPAITPNYSGSLIIGADNINTAAATYTVPTAPWGSIRRVSANSRAAIAVYNQSLSVAGTLVNSLDLTIGTSSPWASFALAIKAISL